MLGLEKVIGTSVGSLLDGVGQLVDRFVTTDEEKAKFRLELEKLGRQRERELTDLLTAEMQARERVVVAELAQGDTFTKRARPSVVYVGLATIVINYVVLPWLAYFTNGDYPTIQLPEQFWLAWGGIVTTWVIGRTAEKRKTTGQ